MNSPSKTSTHALQIAAGAALLDGDLTLPANATGLVVFVHGSGSSRFSPRNRLVAQTINDQGMATLLFDLLTPEEERIDQVTREYRFDIARLSERMIATVDWISQQPALQPLPLGLFGASTGAAAALITAARRPQQVQSVVSRGGRPDLAATALADVQAPTLLIVGGDDSQVIALNRQAAQQLQCRHEVSIVPGATHLFEEPHKLEEVASQACRWFRDTLGPA